MAKLKGVVVRLSVLMLEGILHVLALVLSPPKLELLLWLPSAVAVLQALNEELTQGLPSAPAVAAGPQLSEPRPSDAEEAPMLVEPHALNPADSALPCTSDQPTTEPSPAEQVTSLPPTMKLRLTRKGKRTAPVTATSPPPTRRQRVLSISSPTRSSDMSLPQETSMAREKASDPEVTDQPSDLPAPLPIQSTLPVPPLSPDDQPLGLPMPSASPLIAPPSSAMPLPNLPSTDPAFEASWRLPSEIDLAYTPAADSSSIFGTVDFYGDLAISWQLASDQFWESRSPMGEFDQIARSLVATCSASLSVVQRAAELQRENAALKARLQELEHPAASSAPPEPSLGSLDAYLRAAGESTASARAISHAAFDKLQQLEAALKASESSWASKAAWHQATISELKAKEAELLSQSEELTLLRQGQELLQMGLADAQEVCQATLQSLQAELSKAQEAVSQGQSDLSLARVEAEENRNSLEVYRAGESERLKAYRLAYVRSSFFLHKLGRWMVLLLCHGAAGGVRQAFEQGFLRSAPPATFLDTARLTRELPQDTFPSFEADEGLFLLEASPPAADPALGDISAQAPSVAASDMSVDPASPDTTPADPGLLPSASVDSVPSPPDVV
ncbi:proline-rich protein 36-like [Zingiber officinale]|uniref:proline-rich protein 36-like n=1 Tax=Zingiber officinale TaxID=94328 RepID=UPI001C4BCB0D|nr:proline-rich protein 36-like [Zingiber officinale]